MNGVYGVDVEDLQAEVDRLNSMGNPVAAFLESDEFTEVDPNTTPTQVLYITMATPSLMH